MNTTKFKWTDEADTRLLELSKTLVAEEVAHELGVTQQAVYNRRHRLRERGQFVVRPVLMQNYQKRFCPVCWRRVHPTGRQMTSGHMDSIERALCVFSGEPYSLTLLGDDFMRRYAA